MTIDSKNTNAPKGEIPFVSVIMPIRNEADFIERSLGAVLIQDYPFERMEILIADGMSSDNTRFLITNIPNHKNIPVQILDNPKGIVPTGFNIALAQAKGEIIIRVDGHTIVEPDYVRQCVETLIRTQADNVGGRMNAIGRGAFGEAVALATSSPFGVGGARFHYSNQEEWVDTVYMGAWRRDTFDNLGGFDEAFVRNQDDEFNYRLRSHGGKILLNPEIKSKYYNRATLRSLWKQYYQYGFYKVMVMQKHPQQMKPRQFAPFLLVATVSGGALISPFSKLIRILWLGVVILYVVANLIASMLTAHKYDVPPKGLLPIVFAIMHFGYGLGFLAGLLRFKS